MDDVQRVMQKLGTANKLMEDLIDLAMSDAQISDEEKQMLFSINDNLALYAKSIIETVSDGKVDDDEKNLLKELEQKIITEANIIANDDSSISEDEKTLLNQLVSTLESI
ncbi:MAG: hypothetical protein ACXAE3_17220 [Candidatus Kariarchaeaceae archaeon]|jgi:tellurite resistance protein